MIHCIYCHSGKLGLYGTGVLSCPDCGSLVSNEPAPPYEANYHAYKFLRPKLLYLGIKALRSGLRRGMTVCDIGCGAGHALLMAKLYGCCTVGYDPCISESQVHGCDSFTNEAHILKTAWANSIDLLWCWHTIEHTDQPAALLQLIKDLLAPGGEAWIEFPESHKVKTTRDGCHFPEHRGIPSSEWIVRECLRLGLSIVRVGPTNSPRWIYGNWFTQPNDTLVRVKRMP